MYHIQKVINNYYNQNTTKPKMTGNYQENVIYYNASTSNYNNSNNNGHIRSYDGVNYYRMDQYKR
jgi:hypothetical protein